mmetsp:Transcript_51085/g.90873  ORF Transcript_51085/g.90873 Transcript_51085/m.90873 type:complete len:780 (+) Transcript_51085:107-2446(+)
MTASSQSLHFNEDIDCQVGQGDAAPEVCPSAVPEVRTAASLGPESSLRMESAVRPEVKPRVTTASSATHSTTSSAYTHISSMTFGTERESIMETVQKRIDRLTNFEENFAPVLSQMMTAVPSVRGVQYRDTVESIDDIVNGSFGMKRLLTTRSTSKRTTFSFRTAVTVPITIFIFGVCLGLFLPVALLSRNARDEVLDSYLLVVGEHRQLVDELLQASLLSGALVQRLSSSVSYVENLAKAAQKQSEDCTSMVRVFGIVFFIMLVPVSVIFAFLLSWLLSRSWRELILLMDGIGELNFSKSSTKMRALQRGQRSRIRDIADLQDCFLCVSRGMEAFVRFVPETTVRNILRGDQKAMHLHVSRRNVTIMFCDIKDFTTISEALNQHDLLFLLTRYFSVMTRIISWFDGVVAEILGDGLLCFWNTPDDCEEHAAKACAAALAMQQALIMMSAEFAKLQLPSLAIRIGIHTGSVMTGNIGSELKMKFGCMGDPVNLASRLEGLCKFYRVSVLCSGETFRALPKQGFTCRRLDLVQVKGKNDPTEIYEVIDSELTDELDETDPEFVANNKFIDGDVGVWPDRARSVRLSMRRSMRMAAGSSDNSKPGSPQCTLQMAVAMEAIDDSNKAMSIAQTCAFMWDPLRRKLDQVKNGIQSATTGLYASKPTNTKLFAPAAPAQRDVPTEFRTVTGRVTQVISGEMPICAEQRRAQILLYERALQACQDAQFITARDLIDNLLCQTPEDGPALRLKERCGQYIGADGRMVGLSLDVLATWTGVFNMTEK